MHSKGYKNLKHKRSLALLTYSELGKFTILTQQYFKQDYNITLTSIKAIINSNTKTHLFYIIIVVASNFTVTPRNIQQIQRSLKAKRPLANLNLMHQCLQLNLMHQCLQLNLMHHIFVESCASHLHSPTQSSV